MAKVSFDGTTKIITALNFIVGGVMTLDITVDIYSEWKRWVRDSNNANFFKAFEYIGGEDIIPPEVAPIYAYLANGWRLRPFEADHTLYITGGALLVLEDPSLDPILSTIGAYNVRVRDVLPIRGTILQTAVSGLTPTESQALLDIAADQATITSAIGTINTNIGSIDASIISISADISTMQGDISSININISSIDSSLVTITTDIGTIQTDIGNLQVAQQFMADIEGGRWKIDVNNNQLLFYKADNTTLIATFNTFDEAGNPTSDPARIAERVRV